MAAVRTQAVQGPGWDRHMTHSYPLSPIFHLLFHLTINAIFGKNSMSSFTFSRGVGGERRNFNFIALQTSDPTDIKHPPI